MRGKILPAACACIYSSGHTILKHVYVGMDGRQTVMRKGESWIAVAMHVDETWSNITAGNIQRFGGFVSQIGADGENFAAANGNIGPEGTLADGVDDRTAQKQIICMLFLHSTRVCKLCLFLFAQFIVPYLNWRVESKSFKKISFKA